MTFWIQNYTILFQKDQMQFWPTETMTMDEKLNAITRFVIVLSILGAVLTQTFKFIWIGVITILLLVVYQKSMKPVENFTAQTLANHTVPTKQNPLMNVLLPELNGNPKRKSALKSYEPETEKAINEKVKSGIPDPAIYKGLNNEMTLDYSMRNFYTTANTTVPNDQEGFGEFCYGNMVSAKDGSKTKLLKQDDPLLL
uniref:Minor capsid protein P9 transmembrane helices domain-containing protein n=1 Tax=viral metagenome TaxID=1070528 RepID=A0A6C0AHR8_9ZZZZ